MAVDRNTKKILAFKVGDRSEASLNDLLNEISHCKVKTFASDYYPVYNSVISAGKLIQGKAHTFTVELKNSQLRHYFARLIRKTKCYSKSPHMLIASLNIFIYYDIMKTIIN